MSYLTVIFFIVMTWGFGFTLTRFVKNSPDLFERNIMRIGFGLAAFAVLAVILNIVRIPMLWWIFLILSLIAPVYYGMKHKLWKSLVVSLNKSHIHLAIVVIIFIFTLFMYASGAFGYHWLEDGDPWIHANSVEYIAQEKTLFEPAPHEDIFQYLDPYPPAYDVTMAMMHQSFDAPLIWTLKFFNALIISLSVLFFYFFAKQLTKSKDKAVWATFILAAVPTYFSHFIWAHSLAIMFIFPILYSFERIRIDKRWWWIAGISVAAMLLTQPTQPIKFAVILGVYLLVYSIVMKRVWWKGIGAGVLGAVLSLFWWAGPLFTKGGGFNQPITVGETKFLRIHGSADRVYTFEDFFVAKGQNMINVPVGVGRVVILLLMATFLLMLYVLFKKTKALENKNIINTLYGLEAASLITFLLGFFSPANIFTSLPIGLNTQIWLAFISIILLAITYLVLILHNKESKETWIVFALLGLAITFFGVHGESMPIQLFAFRFWLLFSVFVALVVSEGIGLLRGILTKKRVLFIFLALLFIIGIWFTSMEQKKEVNAATWGSSGSIMQYGGLPSWQWVDENIPDGSKVYYGCDNRFGDAALVSYDKNACWWCKNLREAKKTFLEQEVEQAHSFLQSNQMSFLILDGNCVREAGNITNQRIQEMVDSPLFLPIHAGETMIVFSVN